MGNQSPRQRAAALRPWPALQRHQSTENAIALGGAAAACTPDAHEDSARSRKRALARPGGDPRAVSGPRRVPDRRARRGGGGGEAHAERACRPHRLAVRHARSRDLHGPRPGVCDRAQRPRSAAAVRDRRRRLVRRSWRRHRRRGVAARHDPVSPRRQGRPVPASAERGRGQPLARRPPTRGRLHRARRARWRGEA
jgi:hypothetical protein